jgi:hypothetical protein
VQDGFLGASQLDIKLTEDAISSVFLSCVEAEEEASLFLIVTVDETLAHYFDQRQKGCGTAPYSIAWWGGN